MWYLLQSAMLIPLILIYLYVLNISVRSFQIIVSDFLNFSMFLMGQSFINSNLLITINSRDPKLFTIMNLFNSTSFQSTKDKNNFILSFFKYAPFKNVDQVYILCDMSIYCAMSPFYFSKPYKLKCYLNEKQRLWRTVV